MSCVCVCVCACACACEGGGTSVCACVYVCRYSVRIMCLSIAEEDGIHDVVEEIYDPPVRTHVRATITLCRRGMHVSTLMCVCVCVYMFVNV